MGKASAKRATRVKAVTAAGTGSRMATESKRSPASCQSLRVEVRNGIARVALARPDVHNAFDETLIAECRQVLAIIQMPEAKLLRVPDDWDRYRIDVA